MLIITSDEIEIDTPREVLNMSITIKHMLEDMDDTDNTPIPLYNVSGKIFLKVVEYCKHHLTENTDSRWDLDFCNVNQDTLYDLALAANYLNIVPLLYLVCESIANTIKGKTTEEIRIMFNVVNDFTPEEEEQLRKDTEWCDLQYSQ